MRLQTDLGAYNNSQSGAREREREKIRLASGKTLESCITLARSDSAALSQRIELSIS